MNTETTYNPVRRPTFMDWLSDLYYGSAAGQFAIEATFLIVGCAVFAAAAVAFTA